MKPAAGFTLVEVLVALAIMALAMLTLMGLRTGSLVTSTDARNLRIASAEAKTILSEFIAGQHLAYDMRFDEHPIEGFPGFSYRILIGEAQIQETLSLEAEEEAAVTGSLADQRVSDRLEWLQERERRRTARERGLSLDEMEEESELEEDDSPDEETFEDIAVMVYYFSPRRRDGRGTYLLRGRATTLALSGLTAEEAREKAPSSETGALSSDR